METGFSLIVKGNLEEVKEACKLHKVACFYARECSSGFLVKANADFRDVSEWFCETKGEAPFAAGTLLHFRNIS
jgi:hypothetical protein